MNLGMLSNDIEWIGIAIMVATSVLVIRRAVLALSGRPGSGGFLPRAVRPASLIARMVDASVLGCCGAMIIAIVAAFYGNMLILDELRPQYAAANVIMFACAVVGAAVAVVIALRGRIVTGTIAMAAVLGAYGALVNAGSYPGSWFLPKEMAQPVVQYTINMSGPNAEGAELWVNGMYLGKLPYMTTLDEFEAKVPYWSEPPADYDTDKVQIPQYSAGYTSTRGERRWIKFHLPNRAYWPEKSGPGTRPATGPHGEQPDYYARVRYAGEWGVETGNSGSGGGGGRLIQRSQSDFGVAFPQRQKRLDTLLNMARLADYRVGPEWFQAIETYNADGWIALRNAADNEPRMMEVFDAWATWRYGLDKVTDAETAWQVLQRICKEADEQRHYLSTSVAGRAVELLTPKLPQDRLLDKAVCLIRSSSSLGYFKWEMNGRAQYGYSERPGGVSLGGSGGGGSYFSGGMAGSQLLPMSGFAVAQAVWVLYQKDPVVIQSRIAPEIVCWHYNCGLMDPMLAAVYFGGPAVDHFLLRQPWNVEAGKLPWEERTHSFGGDANKWLYLLACLNDDAGRKFHRQHTGAVMDMIDTLYESRAWHDLTHIEFIFKDPWLAQQYWPRFARLAREKSPHEALQAQWRYLVKLGGAATASMFVDAWKETKFDLHDFRVSEYLLDELEPTLRADVVNQLVQQIKEHPDKPVYADRNETLTQAASGLKDHARPGDKRQREAASLLKQLQEARPADQKRVWKNIPLWLAYTQPDSPLVETLAGSGEADQRLLVMDVLREFATPQHRQLLDRLLQDPSPVVQAAAKDVMAHLTALAAQSPMRYASNSPSATTAPSTTPATSISSTQGDDE